MKKLFTISIAALIGLTACGSEQNELISAIEKSYDLDTGTITSKFEYTTEYNNLELEGTVEGNLKVQFGSKYDLVTANVGYGDSSDVIEYYVDQNGEVVGDAGEEVDSLYAPLYIEAPQLDAYADSIPEPTETTIKVDGQDTTVNQYTLEFAKVDTDIAKTLFDPIVKLGFISSDILNANEIVGKFTMNYFVDPETGLLVKEELSFSNEEDNELSTKTKVKITNTYNYDEVEVELKDTEASEASSEASEASSETSEASSEASEK